MLFKRDISEVEELVHCKIEPTFSGFDSSIAVVRIYDIPRTESGRFLVRQKLTLLLPLVSDQPLKIMEKQTGPWLTGANLGQAAFVSLTYAGGSAWIALSLERPVGIDAVFVEDCLGWESVAETYFDAALVKKIRNSIQPLNEFALQWASFEARLKCLGEPLSENSKHLPPLHVCSTISDGTALAVATNKQAILSL